jgi:SSS family solute:Na+ symporter
VVGIVLSIACAYVARNYSNAMDIIQLVFGFVNAPLFATFLLGMFWKRATSHGAFFGLCGGTLTSMLFHALHHRGGNTPASRARGFPRCKTFPSEMAQNFWLKGLVYSLTPKIKSDNLPFFLQPGVVGIVLLIACAILNIIFW